MEKFCSNPKCRFHILCEDEVYQYPVFLSGGNCEIRQIRRIPYIDEDDKLMYFCDVCAGAISFMNENRRMIEISKKEAYVRERKREEDIVNKSMKGLSSKCTLDPMLAMAILLGGNEHPCDRCNADRKVCRGFPKRDRDHQFWMDGLPGVKG